MSWRCFRITFELLGPLHVGFHKVGNVQRTRYYVPARNLIASCAERLVRSGCRSDSYGGSLAWVREHLAFTYLFISRSDELLNPQYGKDGLLYGKHTPPYQLEKWYIRAHVTTAIEPSAGSAQDESLHEVEFISPYPLNGVASPHRTQVSGHVFMDEEAFNALNPEDTSKNWFEEIHIGGERRYGFGRMCSLPIKPASNMPGCELELNTGRPRIAILKGNPLLAHVPVNDVNAKGAIEPLVGRETVGDSNSFGRVLTPDRMCWAPGSICEEAQSFEIAQVGLWQPVL